MFDPQLPVSFPLSPEVQLAVLSLVFQPKKLIGVNWTSLQIHLFSSEELPFLAAPDTSAGSFSHRFYSDYFNVSLVIIKSWQLILLVYRNNSLVFHKTRKARVGF